MNKSRQGWMDVARAIAIVLVVFTHVSELVGFPSLAYESVCFSVDRVGVPIFLMLSGALMIPKAYQLGIERYYKKYAFRICQFVILLVICSVLTNCAHRYCVRGDDFYTSICSSIKNNNLLISHEKGAAVHLWYMYTIIGFYIIAPFLAVLMYHISSFQSVMLGALLLLSSLLRAENASVFLTYFIAGFLLSSFSPEKKHAFISLAVFVVLLLGVLFIDCLCGRQLVYLHWYSLPPMVPLFMGICAWVMIKYFFRNVNSLWVENIAKNSFGIFLWHYIVLFGLKHIVDRLSASGAWEIAAVTFLICFATFAVSWAISNVLSRIKYVSLLVK